MRMKPVRFHQVALPLAALALYLAGCGNSSKRLDDPNPHAMGQEVRVGNLSYVATETQWMSAMSDELDTVLPKDRFLAITISITNNGTADQTVPLLTLVGPKGEQSLEVSQVRGVEHWLGALRIIHPSETQTGKIVFDVPNGSFKLRVTDGGDLENEHTALIDIPMSVNVPLVVPGQMDQPPLPKP
jgi:Domain of unknown function (DUF4352)